MNQILTFVDLTRTASNAVAQAASIAVINSAHLTICHIRPRNGNESETQIREKMQIYMAQTEDMGVTVELCICTGDLFEEARATVKRLRPDLTVAGTHGTAGIDLSNYGSAIHKLVREVDVPTLVIGDACSPVDGGFQKVLIPAGVQNNFLAGVHLACHLMAEHGEIILYAIVDKGESLNAEAMRNMNEAKKLLDTRDATWHYEEVESAPHSVGYAEQTLAYMRDTKVQMVVIPAEVTRQNALFGKLDKEAMLLNEDGIQVLCVNGKV